MLDYDCLLCHDAACRKACGVMEPDRVLRSLYFDNKDAAVNRLADHIDCASCDGRCSSACPMKIDIRKIISSLQKESQEKVKIDHDVLKCDFCGFELLNPFLLSSSVVASTYEMCARAFDAGWAGAVFKTICLMDIVEASPRFSAIQATICPMSRI